MDDSAKWLRAFAKEIANGVAGMKPEDHPSWDIANEFDSMQAEIEHWKTENDNGLELIKNLTAEIDDLCIEVTSLQDQIATCRELRKYDRIEIERLRILVERHG
jgi:archaellum component FlaC